MFKRLVILALVVLVAGNMTALAVTHPNQAANLVFVDPLAPQQIEALTEVVTFGSGSYRLDTNVYGQTAQLELQFWKLAPSTTYTLWCITLSVPQESRLYSVPCEASDGSEMVVRSDASGNAAFSGSMPALQNTTSTHLTMIALVYELEGHTYGAPRNDIGVNRRVQILAVLPPSQS